jgi:hypothetical protein
MKKINGVFCIVVFVLIFTALAYPAVGAEIEVSARHIFNQGGTTEKVQVEAGDEVRLVYNGLLLSASKTAYSVYMGTRGTVDSLGVGLQGEIAPQIKVWGMVTYNRPDFDGAPVPVGGAGWEGLWYEANERAAPTHTPQLWSAYSNSFDPAWGARVGMDVEKTIYKGFSGFVSVGYSILTLDRTLSSYFATGSVAWQWTIKERFGGPEASLGLKWRF